MQTFLKNESDKIVSITLEGSSYTLLPNEKKSAYITIPCTELTVSTEGKYRRDPVTGTLGLSYFHRFIVTAKYTATFKDASTIRFYGETVHGNNFESYLRIYPFSNDCNFSTPFYSVNNEHEIKEKIAQSDKNETVILQGAGLAGKLIKAKNKFDDIIVGGIIGIFALVIFILLWIFKDFKTAVTVYGAVAVFGFSLWKLFIEKMIKKLKKKAKAKADKKLEQAFLPCDNMPEGIFKGKESYFTNDYISAVFKHSKKRI